MGRAVDILLVDDGPQNLQVLEAILASPDYRLLRAASADEALEKLLTHEPAAIVLDVKMPEMSGLELARIIKGRKKTEHLPILFLTAHFQESQDILAGYSAGAVDYLTKPVNPAILRAKIAVFAELYRKTQALAERTAQLETANEELEALSYSVAHDLRAPLRSIDGFSHLLMEEYGAKLDEAAQAHLLRISAGALQMNQLISDLLALLRVVRAEAKPKSVDLSGLALQVAKQLQEREPAREVELVIAPNLSAHGDPDLLRVALEHLLGNAWKFSANRPRARIEFGVERRGREQTYFVRDNGAGFDMAYVHDLFAPFHRLHNVTEFPGTGMGLAIAQRVIRHHGGRIWADAAVNEGATFYFTLRLAAPAQTVEAAHYHHGGP